MATAPSRTRRARSTSIVKSTCPSISESNQKKKLKNKLLKYDGLTGSIDQMKLMSFPRESDGCRGDCDSALSLLFHVVHHSVAIVNVAQTFNVARVKKHSLGSGRFACIHMSNDADVAHISNVSGQVLLVMRILGRQIPSCFHKMSFFKVSVGNFRNYVHFALESDAYR
jgi:hypothetical protein